MHPYEDHIPTSSGYVGDVELLHQTAALTDADLDAVQPHSIDRFDSVEAQQQPLIRPVGQLENASMITGGVLVGDMRRVDRKRVTDIGVNRAAVFAGRCFTGGPGKNPM